MSALQCGFLPTLWPWPNGSTSLHFGFATHIYRSGLLQRLNELINKEYLEKCLINSKILRISDSGFQHLRNLDCLYLGGNNLTKVPSNAFEVLKSLKRLSLSHNHIELIQPFAFKRLVNLEYLLLKNSRIKNVTRGGRRKRDSKSWMGISLPYRDGRNCWWLSLRIIYSNHWSWLVWSSGFSSEKVELILLTHHGCLRMKEYYSCNSWSMAMAHSELVPSLL